MTTYSDILEAAMTLPPTEREELAMILFESTDEPVGNGSPELSQAWLTEIVRRSEAYKRGESKPIPWDQIREDIRQRYERHA